MPKKPDDAHGAAGLQRRDVMKGLGVAGIATVGVLAAGASAESAEVAETGVNSAAGQYRETAHVRRVYELARF
jgi:hypothetical protein